MNANEVACQRVSVGIFRVQPHLAREEDAAVHAFWIDCLRQQGFLTAEEKRRRTSNSGAN